MKKTLIALLTGILMGILTSRFLFVNSALALLPWSAAGLLLGFWCEQRKQAAVVGGMYGFFLLFSFMMGSYDGADSLVSRIIPFAVLGLGGGLGGIFLTEISVSFKLKSKM